MKDFFVNKIKERLTFIDINLLREISVVLGLGVNSKKNKAEIIDEICSVCYFQDKINYDNKSSFEYSKDDDGYFDETVLPIFSKEGFPNKQLIGGKNGKTIIDYRLVEPYSESKVRASSSSLKYKIVDKDGKEIQPGSINEEKVKSREVIKYYGYIEQEDDSFKIVSLNSNESFDINVDELTKWDLEQFDTVGFNRYWNSEHGRYMTHIVNVNERTCKLKGARNRLEKIKKIETTEEFDFSRDNNICTLLSAINPIRKGDRVLISTSEFAGKRRIAMEISKTFKKKNVNVFAIYQNAQDELSLLFEDVDKNATLIDDKLSPVSSVNKVATAFMRAKKYVEEGKDVVMVVGDLDEYCSNLIKIIGKKLTRNILKYLESLFNNSGKYENGGSMTIIGVIGMEDGLLTEYIKTRFNFYAPLKDADMSLYPQVDFSRIKINPR